MTNEKAFTLNEMAKILGKPTRFVADWADRGLFIADVQQPSGQGTRRLFSLASVLMAAVMLKLQQAGIRRNILKGLLAGAWKNGFFQVWAEGYPKLTEEDIGPFVWDEYIKSGYLDKQIFLQHICLVVEGFIEEKTPVSSIAVSSLIGAMFHYTRGEFNWKIEGAKSIMFIDLSGLREEIVDKIKALDS
jgi:hypothetical protein